MNFLIALVAFFPACYAGFIFGAWMVLACAILSGWTLGAAGAPKLAVEAVYHVFLAAVVLAIVMVVFAVTRNLNELLKIGVRSGAVGFGSGYVFIWMAFTLRKLR